MFMSLFICRIWRYISINHLEEVCIDPKLHFVEELVKRMDQEIKTLSAAVSQFSTWDGTRSEVLNSRWSLEIIYPHLFHKEVKNPSKSLPLEFQDKLLLTRGDYPSPFSSLYSITYVHIWKLRPIVSMYVIIS